MLLHTCTYKYMHVHTRNTRMHGTVREPIYTHMCAFSVKMVSYIRVCSCTLYCATVYEAHFSSICSLSMRCGMPKQLHSVRCTFMFTRWTSCACLALKMVTVWEIVSWTVRLHVRMSGTLLLYAYGHKIALSLISIRRFCAVISSSCRFSKCF